MARISATDQSALEAKRVERVYSTLAGVYDLTFDWALGPGRRRAVRTLEFRSGDAVLEVGIGTGLSIPYYPPHCRLTGVDISAPMLERCRRRVQRLGLTHVDLQIMDAAELRFPAGSFDHVVAPYVISVVPDPNAVMREMIRVCRPGGTIIVVNHFLSDRALPALFEKTFTPLSKWLGFRMDLPFHSILGHPELKLSAVERVNLFGMWTLATFGKAGKPAGQ